MRYIFFGETAKKNVQISADDRRILICNLWKRDMIRRTCSSPVCPTTQT